MVLDFASVLAWQFETTELAGSGRGRGGGRINGLMDDGLLDCWILGFRFRMDGIGAMGTQGFSKPSRRYKGHKH
jgi:hypothetical protein